MTIPFRRKQEGKTNYKKRLRLVSSNKLRMVIRRTNKNVTVQMIEFSMQGDKVLVSAHTHELKKYGWKGSNKNIPASYLAGLLCGVKAKKAGITEAVPDIGMRAPIKGSLVYAALKGAIDAGLNIPCSEEALPPQDRLTGKHIENNNATKFTKSNPKEIVKNFGEVKNKIMKEGA
ncbi:50S ribosomal protein L18 [Candidatus Woesearchaeota archaeon]|nr:50S ribosomal protein L18 [Candidatus Woesearchaeota archaeon]